jgi:hypothetical protein
MYFKLIDPDWDQLSDYEKTMIVIKRRAPYDKY